MKKPNSIAYWAILSLLFFSCNDPEIKVSESTNQPLPLSASSERVSTQSVTSGYNWWSFFGRSVAHDRYNVSYGYDGITWPGLENCSGMIGFYPEYVKTIHFNNTIYLLYYVNNFYYLKTSSDGLTWSSPVIQSHLRVNTSSGGTKRFHEVAVVNGEIYAFQYAQLDPSQTYSMGIKTYKYSFGQFQLYGTSAELPGSEFDNHQPGDTPSFAEVSGQYFLFINDATLLALESTDLINWSSGDLSSSFLCNTITDTDAVVFGNQVYVTYVDYLAYVRYAVYYNNNGNWVWEDGGHPIDVARTSGINVPIATDGTKMVVNFRGLGNNDRNYIAYSDGSNPWTVQRIGGSSSGGKWWRDLLYTGN